MLLVVNDSVNLGRLFTTHQESQALALGMQLNVLNEHWGARLCSARYEKEVVVVEVIEILTWTKQQGHVLWHKLVAPGLS